MDRALKERLIGAVVLVGTGVWLIPWVLDGPPARDGQPAALELPVTEETVPLRTRTIHLDQRDAPAAADSRSAPAPTPAAESQQTSPRAAASQASEQPEEARAAQPPATPPVDEPAPDATASRSPQPAQPSSPQSQSQSQAEAAPQADAEEPAALAEAPAGDTGAPARSVAEPPSSPAPREETRTAAAQPAAGQWQVQLGSFGQEENARRLAERVSGHGHTPSITDVRTGGQVLHRVRVGPYETRRQAEDAAAALSSQGFVAQVVSAN